MAAPLKMCENRLIDAEYHIEHVISIVVGPALGNIRSLFEKVKALDAKYGKFEFAICVGDFFGSASEENDTQFEDLLASRTARSSPPEISHTKLLTQPLLKAPLTTYIMTGIHSLPEKVQRKIEETGGEICPNVMYLGEDYLQRARTIFDVSQTRLV